MLESKICFRDDPEYIHCKEELGKSYQEKINSAIQNQITTISCIEKEITDGKKNKY